MRETCGLFQCGGVCRHGARTIPIRPCRACDCPVTISQRRGSPGPLRFLRGGGSGRGTMDGGRPRNVWGTKRSEVADGWARDWRDDCWKLSDDASGERRAASLAAHLAPRAPRAIRRCATCRWQPRRATSTAPGGRSTRSGSSRSSAISPAVTAARAPAGRARTSSTPPMPRSRRADGGARRPRGHGHRRRGLPARRLADDRARHPRRRHALHDDDRRTRPHRRARARRRRGGPAERQRLDRRRRGDARSAARRDGRLSLGAGRRRSPEGGRHRSPVNTQINRLSMRELPDVLETIIALGAAPGRSSSPSRWGAPPTSPSCCCSRTICWSCFRCWRS